jgi:hypothetical protein
MEREGRFRCRGRGGLDGRVEKGKFRAWRRGGCLPAEVAAYNGRLVRDTCAHYSAPRGRTGSHRWKGKCTDSFPHYQCSARQCNAVQCIAMQCNAV